jgi:hypothetical protein
MPGNTTPIHGKVCRIAQGTAGSGTNIAETSGWNATCTRDKSDASSQGEDGKKALLGQYVWTLGFSGSLCLGIAGQKAVHDACVNGTKLTGATALEFVLDAAGNYYTGDLNVLSFQVTSVLGDVVKFTASLESTGTFGLTLGV